MNHASVFRNGIVPIVLLVVVASIALFAFARSQRNKPARVEARGPFEILTWEIGYISGWNQGPLHRATTEVYSLNHGGAPFRFVGKAGMFTDEEQEYERVNAVITFPAPDDAFVVNVGDPNNRSFYYLVREVDGAPRVTLLGEATGQVSADWLDPTPEAMVSQRDLAVHRAHREGGRLLLLGDYTVLDTKTLEVWPVQQSFVSPATYMPPISMSPDGKSFVRVGYGDGEVRLVVYDYVDGNTYSLSVDRSVMRYNVQEEIDAAWLEHHFEWKAVEGGHERLERRELFEPLPYKGRLTIDSLDGFREYRIQPVGEDMQAVVVAYLREKLSLPLRPRRQYSTSDELEIDGRTIYVMYTSGHVGVWMDRGTDSTPVESVAAELDAMLATGAWDAHFVP